MASNDAAAAKPAAAAASTFLHTQKKKNKEVQHYVVTAHPPGGVLQTAKCHFLAKDSSDVVIGKSRRLEVRQWRQNISKATTSIPEEGHPLNEEDQDEDNSSPFPIVFSCPIHGRIATLAPLALPNRETDLLFVTTDQFQYAVIGYDPAFTGCGAASISHDDDPNNNTAGGIRTYVSGSLKDDWSVLGTLSECGPLVAVDPHMRCIVLHLYDGLVTVFPILTNSTSRILGPVFHSRLEERTVLGMTLLHHLDPSETPPHVCLLHQDSRGAQHVSTHVVDLPKSQLWSIASAAGQTMASQCEWLKKSRIDGGSSLLIPVPPRAPAVAAASASKKETTAISTNLAPVSGGVLILGQRQITYVGTNSFHVLPIPPGLLLSWTELPQDVSGMPRFLLGDEFGNLHMLTVLLSHTTAQQHNNPMMAGVPGAPSNHNVALAVMALQLDTLGSCTLSNSLQYLDQGLVFCGSTLGDSQLVQIHDEPIPVAEDEDDAMDENVESSGPSGIELKDTTYLSVVEEYTHLGPIVDFDLVPMARSGEQCQVVTASGSSKSGSIRVIRNGIGMKEYASVELSGIQNMWSLRKHFQDTQDTYLVQSYVGQTRVLGVTALNDDLMDGDEAMADASDDGAMEEDHEEDVGGTLEEVVLPGLESYASTLNICNVFGDLMLQITETQIRVTDLSNSGELLDVFEPDLPMTVATSNEAGQILVALRGGKVLYMEINEENKIVEKAAKQMEREVSCLNVHPFTTAEDTLLPPAERKPTKANLCAVGLWDDFTVRILSLETQLQEVLQIHLSTDDDENKEEDQRRSNRNNMMARSLCLITLDFSSSSASSSGHNSSKRLSASPGVDMLFVGLGDGTLVSFAVNQEDARVRVQSKKEVSLGTQRINLVPLLNEKGGSCILATGDRPTVIYLTGTSSAKNYNPKLCYSNVNLSPAEDSDQNDISRPHSHESISVNVATPFFSPLLFDAMGREHYSLCVADDTNLRLGVIDDIQKLHVTTYRLGMAPRRIVHCPEGQLFAVGCIESGIKQMGTGGGEINMGNCIRFLDDDTFDDVQRIALEPCEMIMSMTSVSMKVNPSSEDGDSMQNADSNAEYRPYLIVGTAYALHDEDEPTKGRVIVLSCSNDDEGNPDQRKIQTVAELQVRGGVYSVCQFFNGRILITINSKTQMCRLVKQGQETLKLEIIGVGHHGHILSLYVSSRAQKSLGAASALPSTGSLDGPNATGSAENIQAESKEQLAVVGDLMRSISLVQYYPEHDTLEEVARDFNTNWTTAVSMLNDDIYLGSENWNNLFVLRRNTKATSEEVRCRLDTVGEFHLGEMVNKFMSGSLVMPSNIDGSSNASGSGGSRRRALASPQKPSSKAAASPTVGSSALRSKRPAVCIGSQTLFGTVDGTLGSILGLDGPTAAFFSCLERSMQLVVKPVGNFSHQRFRAFNAEHRHHPSHGFVDGDMVESFLDLDKKTMEKVVQQMNRDGGWEGNDSAFASASGRDKEDRMEDEHRPQLVVEDVLAVVEEMTMLH